MSARKKNPPPRFFVDVLLPLAIEGTFTYHCTAQQFEKLQKGIRVAVEFGRQKVQTAVVVRKHKTPPHFSTKPVLEILDDRPVINDNLWKLLDFIVRYYISTPGKTLRLALPSSFLLESETLVSLRPEARIPREDTDDETYLLIEALEKNGILSLKDLSKITGSPAKTLKWVNRKLKEGWLRVHYHIKEKYKPKYITYVDLSEDTDKPSALLKKIPDRASKQQEAFLWFLSKYLPSRKPVLLREMKEHFSDAVIRGLIDRGILEKKAVAADRQIFNEISARPVRLNSVQTAALQSVERGFEEGKPVLLHGVTAAGKTEMYIRLIEKKLREGKQVLYMVPEISLTAQLVRRLKKHFGNKTAVYHSRYSPAERREIWMHALDGDSRASLVIGTRSSVFVPFKNLGLVIVDEEHDDSYKEKQYEPAYHARDLALVKGRIHGASVLLGSATPSFDSYHHAKQNKYHYVSLTEKYHRTPEPDKVILDFTAAYKEGRVKKDFIVESLDAIRQTVENGLQVMVFLNRRGYAPLVTCKTCGHTESCPHCSVSLTYHQSEGKLKCHYCGYAIPKTDTCRACGSTDLSIQGTGTENVERQLREFFPRYRIVRMDSATVRGKKRAEEIITGFEQNEYDIIVGTQMITKGLDFGNIGLVVVVKADQMIHFPEFRAHERAFQTLVQVAGRTGRRNRKDAVYVQTFQPLHPVIQYFLQNDYDGMFTHEMQERRLFKYPPYYRLIKLELKSKNPQNLYEGASWLDRALRYYFSTVLGPSEPPVAKIRDFYILELLIKLPADKNTMQARQLIKKITDKFRSVGNFRNVRLKIDADPSG